MDRLVAASVPSYKVLYTTGIEFNASDLSKDDKTFVKNRLEVAVAKKDHLKTELVRSLTDRHTSRDYWCSHCHVTCVCG